MDVIVNNTIKSVTEVLKEEELIEVLENKTETIYKSNVVETQKLNNISKLPVTGY